MSCLPFSPETSVSEALAACRGLQRVFISHGTACVGCYLARFCTLKDVAATYSVPLDTLLAELNQAALAQTSDIIGAEHDQQA